MTNSREGTKEECDGFADEVRALGYVVISQVIVPIGDHWMVTVTYIDPELDLYSAY